MLSWRNVTLVPFTLWLGACAGDIGGAAISEEGAPSADGKPGGTSTSRPGPGGAPGGTTGVGGMMQPGGKTPPPAADGAGPWRPKRLTREEFDHTVRDLLGDKTAPAEAAFPSDTRGTHGFLESTAVSDVFVQRLLDASGDLAAAAIGNLGALFTCAPATAGEESCVGQFIATFGRRAFRRPLTTEETIAFTALDKKLTTELKYPYADRIRVLVRAFLQSPEFLYHGPMRGQAPAGAAAAGLVPLGNYEIASRLSYFLWRTMPDEALFASAAAGKLTNPKELEKEVRRMVADKRSFDAIDRFQTEWLMLEHLDRLSKDPKVFSTWNDKLRTSIQTERTTFLRTWLNEDGTLDGLLTAPHSFVDAGLAKIYGAAAPTSGMPKTTLPAGQRAGVLTQIAFLAEHADASMTKPVARGRVLYEQLTCGIVPPPPLDVPEPRPPGPNLTTRERFEEHSKNECARACHALMDPMGFAFENYDALGGHRIQEGGKTIDTTGTITLPTEGDKRFANAVELVGVLGKSDDVRRCVTKKWARFAFGRAEEGSEEASLDRAFATFKAARHDVRELLVALATSKAFLHRTLVSGEVLP